MVVSRLGENPGRNRRRLVSQGSRAYEQTDVTAGTVFCKIRAFGVPNMLDLGPGHPPDDVRFWPKADMSYCNAHVRFRG
jgi:hypothetical protein